jgi:uncharacterized protein YbjT (DUF2867 family)
LLLVITLEKAAKGDLGMYVITGATGNIGSKIAARLISQGKPVRLIGRSEDSLKKMISGKAERNIGTLEDAGFLTKAFTGATAVFAMIPPNVTAADIRAYQNNVGRNIVTALKNAGVKHVVSLSSIGAHLPERAGVVQGLYDFEQMLNKLDKTNVIHLRAGYFMENLFSAIESIKKYNMIGTPIKADLAFPLVATKDIAGVAAEKMLKLNFKGKSVEYVLGPEDTTYNEITQVIADRLGKPDLNYMETSYDDTRDYFIKGGISESFADGIIEMTKGMNEGIIFEDIKRTPRNTTPTRLEEFAATFEKIYNI